jgi:hypothetical protein
MNLIERFTAFLASRDLQRRLARPYHASPIHIVADYATKIAAERRQLPQSLEEFGERLGEQLRLAKKIADRSARCEVESYCTFERMGRFTWYDTHSLSKEGVFVQGDVADEVRYLDLRGRLIRHPVQKHLVRFAR